MTTKKPKRMGRPPLPAKEKARHYVPTKMTDDQLSTLDSLASSWGLSRSATIHECLRLAHHGGSK